MILMHIQYRGGIYDQNACASWQAPCYECVNETSCVSWQKGYYLLHNSPGSATGTWISIPTSFNSLDIFVKPVPIETEEEMPEEPVLLYNGRGKYTSFNFFLIFFQIK